jgi:hypothetical protein
MNREDADNRANVLVKEHWDYIERLLWAHDMPPVQVDIARFHYKEAFRHGYKHCWEDILADKLARGDFLRELQSYENPKNN